MSWRERLAFLTSNGRPPLWWFRTNYHDDEKIGFAKHLVQETDYECHAMKNGHFSSKPVENGIHENGINHSGHKDSNASGSSLQDDFILEEAEIDGDPRDKITEWQAGWNITNAIQGMFIVSFPYTVLQGGYWAIVAMVVVAYICCHTGNILVDCLYDLDPMGHRVRVRSSYVDIAEAVWGAKYGARIVHLAQLIELLMTCILYVLLCGDLIQGSFPNIPLSLTSWILVCTTPLLACAFLTSLRHVSTLSMWCTIAHMLVNGIILIYCLTKAHQWHWGDVRLRIDIWTFPISMGIIVFSYTSQIFLPSLECKLQDRSKFKCVMTWTHVSAALFKAIFSYVGFLTWGFGTLEVITNNLQSTGLKLVVNLILVCKALLSYPLPYFASVELLQTAFFKGRSKTVFPSCLDDSRHLKWWGLALRLGLVFLTCAMAITVPHFALLMGLIGSFTGTMLSFVWPCYFHIRLRWHVMSRLTRFFDIIIIVLGALCGGVGIYYSAHALSRAFRGLPPEPTHTLKMPINNN